MSGCKKANLIEEGTGSNGTGIFVYDIVKETNMQITHASDVLTEIRVNGY